MKKKIVFNPLSGYFDYVTKQLNANEIGTGVVDNTEYSYLDGVTSPIQTQLDSKALHIITPNIIWVTKNGNDTTGDGTIEKPYLTINKALSTITTASSSNPFKICVGAGVFIEDTINAKSFVWIEGAEQDETVIQINASNKNLVVGADNSGISKCLVTGVSGSGFAAVYYQSTTGTTNTSFFVKDVRFGNNDTQAIADGTNAATALFFESCKFGSIYQFNHGFLGRNGGRVILRNCTTTGLTAPYPDYIVKAIGSGSQAVLNSCQIRSGGVTTGACFHLADGGLLRASSVNIRMFGKGLWIENIGAGSIADVNGILCEANTMDVVVDHPDADGTFTGSADHTKIYINPASTFSPVFACNRLPNDGTGSVTIGDILQGDRYDRFANLSLVARKATTLGAIEDEEMPFVDFLSGLDVKVIAGRGFVNEPTDLYLVEVSWPETTLSIPANSTKYIYVDHLSNILTSDSPTNPQTTVILGRVNSDATGIRFIENSDLPMNHYGNKTERFLRSVLGPTWESGCIVTESSTPLKLDVTPGSYFFGVTNFLASGGVAVKWETFYRDGSGGWTSIPNEDTIYNNLYDNGSGTLVSIPAGKFVRHHLYVVGDGGNEKWFLVVAQQLFDSLAEANDGPLPLTPPFFTDALTRVAGIIIESGSASIGTNILDLRIRPGQAGPSGTAVTRHGDLTGLPDDDHKQYLLVSGARPMTGPLNMGGNGITNVGLVDGVDVSNHASRHNFNGADPLLTGVPSELTDSTNVEGIDNTRVPRLDHQHAHGNRGGGSLHALATTIAHGFMSLTDKTKLDGIASGATAYDDEMAQDAVGSILLNTSTIGFSYDDVAPSISANIILLSITDSYISNSANISLSKLSSLPVNRALVSDSSGIIDVSSVNSTELSYLSGVSSSIQSQLNLKLSNVLNNGQIFIGSASNVATGVTLSGEATLDNSGVVTLSDTGVSSGVYGSGSVVGTFIVNSKGRLTAAANIPIAIAWNQVSKVGSSLADLATRSASDLNSGTLDDARLSSNVALKNINNNFTASQTINVTGASSTFNLAANSSQTNIAKLIFTGTTGTGDFQISGDGGDIYWQGGGGRALQMASYHQIDLIGGRNTGTTPVFLNGSNATYNVRVLNTNSSTIGLILRGAASQSGDLLQIRNSTETVLGGWTSAGNAYGQTPIAANHYTTKNYVDSWNPVTTKASATATTTTTSGSDVLMDSMTLTPNIAGDYSVNFSTTLSSNNTGADIFVSIYVGGVLVADSVRTASPQFSSGGFGGSPSLNFPISTNGEVTVNGSQAIEIRWRRSAGTASALQRTLTIRRVR